jgi:hypothetical protein
MQLMLEKLVVTYFDHCQLLYHHHYCLYCLGHQFWQLDLQLPFQDRGLVDQEVQLLWCH